MFYLPRSIFDKIKLGLKYYQIGTREIEDGFYTIQSIT
jgi:hypothetical protein